MELLGPVLIAVGVIIAVVAIVKITKRDKRSERQKNLDRIAEIKGEK